MTSRLKKNYATAGAERELARFEEAVDEFDCRWDEAQFDETLRNLTSVELSPRDEKDGPPVVRYDVTNVTSRPNSFYKAITTLSFCRPQLQAAVTFPIGSCPNLKAAFARARDSRRSE